MKERSRTCWYRKLVRPHWSTPCCSVTGVTLVHIVHTGPHHVILPHWTTLNHNVHSGPHHVFLPPGSPHWSCQFGKRPTSIWQQSNGITRHQTKQKCFVRGTNDKLDPAQEANMEVLSGFEVVSLLTLELRNQLCNRCHHDYLPRSGIPSRIQMVVFHKSAGDATIWDKKYLFSWQHKWIGYWMSFSRLHYLFRHNWEKLPPIIRPEQQHFEYTLVLCLFRKM